MSNDTQSQVVSAETLKSAEQNLRDTVARLGNQHPEVLKVLEHYIALLRQAGNDDLATKLEPKAKAIRDILSKESSVKPSDKSQESTAEEEPSAVSDEAIFLYNSKGEHVAVAYRAGLYSPQGENIGRLLDDYDVFLDRRGWYLGQIVDNNRLARDITWIHRHLNFGDRGNEGNRAGWGRGPDIERTYFDRGFEDVEFED